MAVVPAVPLIGSCVHVVGRQCGDGGDPTHLDKAVAAVES